LIILCPKAFIGETGKITKEREVALRKSKEPRREKSACEERLKTDYVSVSLFVK
jgi:hypothetical protein